MESGKRTGSKMVSVAAGSVWESRMKIDHVKGGIKVFNGQEMSCANDCEDRQAQVKQPSLRSRNAGAGEKRNSEKNTLVVAGIEKSESKPAGSVQVDKTCDTADSSCSFEDENVNRAGGGYSVEDPGGRSNHSSSSTNTRCSDANLNYDTGSNHHFGLKKTRSEPLKAASADINGNEATERKAPAAATASQAQAQAQAQAQLRKVKSEPNRVVTSSNQSSIKEICDRGDTNSNFQSNTQGQTEDANCTSGTCGSSEMPPQPCSINEKMMLFDPLGMVTPSNSDHKQTEVEGRQEEALILLSKVDIKAKASPDPDFKSHRVSTTDSSSAVTVMGLKLQEEEEAATTCSEFEICQDKVKVITSDPVNVNGDGDDQEFVNHVVIDNASEIEVDMTTDAKKTLKSVKEINHALQTKTTRMVTVHKFKPQVIKKSSSIASNSISRKSLEILNEPTPNLPSPNPAAKYKKPDDFCRIPETHGRLQGLVDLVMWRDVSRSAFVFGIGTFIIISSSYAKDLNISLISAGSYLGLVYLATMFLYRSIMCRGIIDEGDSPQMNMLGEEEALWLLKLVLPYLNEFLLKLRCLFSGDPAVTMKLALVLFVLARCGSSITIGKVVKMGFFGVFVIPKLCSSYSTQITAYGKFWVRRFQDAWQSCLHKKVVAFVIFTLVWNFSSVVARAWTAFILFVAFRYYQQSLTVETWVEDHTGLHDLQQRRIRRHRHNKPSTEDLKKEKKRF